MEQDLYPASPYQGGECERCYRVRRGRWYVDDQEGGSEWFYCDACAGAIRGARAGVQAATVCERCHGLRTVPNTNDHSLNVRMACPACAGEGDE